MMSGSTAFGAAVSGPDQAPKKHRRPALSCVQCRRRKVKCDRNIPCNRCTQSKNTVCQYDPEGPARARAIHSVASTASPSTSIDNFSISQEPVLKGTLSLSNSVTPNSKPQVMSWVSGSRAVSDQDNVQHLQDRIRQLESALSTMTYKDKTPKDTVPLDGNRNPILRGSAEDTQFFGMGHWMMFKKEFDQIHFLKAASKSGTSEVPRLLKKCKNMARAVKAQRPNNSLPMPDVQSQVPPRETSDTLVQNYFRVFESTHRILHRHAFYKDYESYWNSPSTADTGFIVKLLLVMAIGTAFCDDDITGSALCNLAYPWVSAAQAWLHSKYEKSRLNIAGIEVQCLMFLTRQMHSFDTKSLWITAGSLIRSAMKVGLHRDPSHFPKITVFQAECRRRLWATVIEMATQSSLDCGMPPLFSLDDFDCSAPSNYDDADILDQTTAYPPKKADSIFTDSSIQIALFTSLRTRLDICNLLNNFRSDPSYERILTLGSDLTNHIRSHSQLYAASEVQFTTFHKNTLDLLNRRFLLALHLPFAIKAKKNPQYYFSRKVTLEAAMTVLAYPGTCDNTLDFGKMTLKAGGFLREAIARASSAVCLELINQINEDYTSSFLPGPSPASIARNALHEAVDRALKISRGRLEHGETNVKGYMFFAMIQAQTLAMEKGENVQDAVMGSAIRSLEEAYGLLKDQVTQLPADTPPPASVSEGSLNGMLGVDNIDWDMLDTNIDFDVEGTWLFDGLEYGGNPV